MLQEKGITLIALVVTIIILLILAGVTLNALIGGEGLITRALKAEKEMKKAQYFEEINVEIIDEQVERASETKEEFLIESIQGRIEKKTWQRSVIMCKDEGNGLEDETEPEKANILLVETKDGYEIIIEVNNNELTARIRDHFEKVGKDNKYKIKYDQNGGIGETIEEQEIRKGFSIKLKENTYKKDKYVFAGWCEDKGGEGELYQPGSTYIARKDTTLYAIWSDNVATIKFNANAGQEEVEGEMKDITIEKNKDTKLPQNEFKREGYNFIKWNTQANGEGTSYENKGTINVNEDRTLYAQWEKRITGTIKISNEKKITEGTEITIGATALSSGIKSIELKIGATTIYSEPLKDNNTEYNKTLGINDLTNLANIEFYNDKTVTLKVTSINDEIEEINVNEVKNYTIGNDTNLKKLATLVNEGTTFEGETILQLKDIDLNNTSWDPIGNNNSQFKGTYNGNGKSVKNLKIDNSQSRTVGLFGTIGDTGTIKNITVNGTVNQKSILAAGGIAGRNRGIIENCVNNASITGSTNVANGIGGIVGNNLYKIVKCTNNGTIEGVNCGGIVGRHINDINDNRTITIEGCTNNGDITGLSSSLDNISAGGLIGVIDDNTNTTISDCKNTKEATVNGIKNVGGICGYQGKGTISLCINEGKVEAKQGITGGIAGYSQAKIEESKNKGEVISDESPSDQENTQGTGGIAGVLSTNEGIITECSNSADIKVKMGFYGGGIVGRGKNSKIEKSYNNGSIYVKTNAAGGIIGRSYGMKLLNVYNNIGSKNIIAEKNNCGGMIGYVANNSAQKTIIENCYNIGSNLSASENVGEIVGFIDYSTEMTNCYYLNSINNEGIGLEKITATKNSVSSISQDFFKQSVTQNSSVAYLLNGRSSTGEWSQSPSINEGYPYLVNNIPE